MLDISGGAPEDPIYRHLGCVRALVIVLFRLELTKIPIVRQHWFFYNLLLSAEGQFRASPGTFYA